MGEVIDALGGQTSWEAGYMTVSYGRARCRRVAGVRTSVWGLVLEEERAAELQGERTMTRARWGLPTFHVGTAAVASMDESLSRGSRCQ